MPLGVSAAACQVDSGCLAFGCKSTRVPWQPLEGTDLAQAAGATVKVTVIQCGCALMGSKTESRGASGGHGERCAGIGVVPGLGWSGSKGHLWAQVVMVQPSCGLHSSAHPPHLWS